MESFPTTSMDDDGLSCWYCCVGKTDSLQAFTSGFHLKDLSAGTTSGCQVCKKLNETIH
jgi:hypothetical protein